MNTTNHTSPIGEELKPCPFCGGTAELQEYEEVDATRWAALVRCTVCGVDGKRGYANNRMGCFDAVNGLHMQSAIAAWNSRADRTIGEDAANVAIGEREAFEAAFRSAHEFPEQADQVEFLKGWQAGIMFARAALTAEKVAGESSDCIKLIRPNTGDEFRALRTDSYGIAELLKEGWQIAPQQPAQPAAQTLALTDAELTALIRKVEDKLGIVWYVPDDSETYAWRTTNTNERDKFARAFAQAIRESK